MNLRYFFGLVLGIALIPTAIDFSAQAAPSCKAHREFPVADFAFSLTDLGTKDGRTGAQVLKDLGVKTVFRYYDQRKETIACKTLVPEETDFLIENGFSIAVVFQNNNDQPENFFPEGTGTSDAKRALALAKANGQPAGSAIYFGVDGPDQKLASGAWMYNLARGKDYKRGTKHYEKVRRGRKHHKMKKEVRSYNRFRDYVPIWFKDEKGNSVKHGSIKPEMILPFIDQYFDEINAVFSEYKDEKGQPKYRVGAYGSGLICRHLLGPDPIPPSELKPGERRRGVDAKIDFCWLGQARGWPQTREFLQSGLWNLDQQLVTKCHGWSRKSGGRVTEFDFDRIQVGVSDFGQWQHIENRDLTDFVRPEKNIKKTCYAW